MANRPKPTLHDMAGSSLVHAIAASALVAIFGLIVAAVSDLVGGVALSLIAAGLVGLGALVGFTTVAAVGLVVFGIAMSFSEIGVLWLIGGGATCVAALALVDLSISLRPASQVELKVVSSTYRSIVVVAALGAGLGGLVFVISTATVWQAVVLPLALVATGLALNVGADSHAARVSERTGTPRARRRRRRPGKRSLLG